MYGFLGLVQSVPDVTGSLCRNRKKSIKIIHHLIEVFMFYCFTTLNQSRFDVAFLTHVYGDVQRLVLGPKRSELLVSSDQRTFIQLTAAQM